MRKRFCALMMILALSLSACESTGGYEAEKLLHKVRGSYLEMLSCMGKGEIVADYGQRVYHFSIDFSWEKDGETVLCLTAPENVAGATARIKNGETALEFDGVMIETGPLNEDGLTPIDVIPALLHSIQEGYISECVQEEQGEDHTLHMICRDPDKTPGNGIETQMWFDPESFSLLCGEISVDGVTIIRCQFSEFSITKALSEEE